MTYTLSAPGQVVDQGGTRTADVMQAIRARVASRALAAGDRLPSIRGFAATMGVSPSTVVEAYDRLVAEGLIRARRGSGFYVSATALPPLALAQDQPQRDRAFHGADPTAPDVFRATAPSARPRNKVPSL